MMVLPLEKDELPLKVRYHKVYQSEAPSFTEPTSVIDYHTIHMKRFNSKEITNQGLEFLFKKYMKLDRLPFCDLGICQFSLFLLQNECSVILACMVI